MTMTRTDWLAVTVALAVLVHALLPRYEWRDPGGDATMYVRIDRWTGKAEVGQFFNKEAGHISGLWLSIIQIRALHTQTP